MTEWIDWIGSHRTLLASLVVGALAVLWLLPRAGRQRRFGAAAALLASLVAAGWLLVRPHFFDVLDPHYRRELLQLSLFWLFGGGAILSGVAMISAKNPVYAALWFAMVTLSVCGLFLLNSAPFLAAATVIVYAGAIIVTFVFVIMLARQGGEAAYDQRAQQPLLATVAAFLLLGAILTTLLDWRGEADRAEYVAGNAPAAGFLPPPGDLAETTGVLSRPPATGSVGPLRGLGRSLFGDYLFAVEIAGTLLMIATIGAVAIAPRRARGGL